MPEAPKEIAPVPPPSNPKDEIRESLKGILALVEEKKAAAKATDTPATPWGWVAGLIIAVLVFVALAFVAWDAWKKGREIAALKHKVDLDEEKKAQAEADAQVAKAEEERKRLEGKAEALNTKIKSDKLKLVELEKERKAAHDKIDLVTTWEDLDTASGGKPNG